jgi:tRNA G10  N-methylase Trm11
MGGGPVGKSDISPAPGRLRQVHPFPARMAPELALEAVARHRKGAVVLDPMCGSGTVLGEASRHGLAAIGFDMDPLAILLSKVACTQISSEGLVRSAHALVKDAKKSRVHNVSWIDSDPETSDFVNFWFGREQQEQLRKIAVLLKPRKGGIANALRVALSRTIITKSRGASLARDVSHSRPHRVGMDNDFDVYEGFLRAAKHISTLVAVERSIKAEVGLGDARRLPRSLAGKVDLVVTSPPYLNAIDYMRGHRLSLVWLGHQLSALREIRSTSIGVERRPDGHDALARELIPPNGHLSKRQQAMLDRYTIDAIQMMEELHRVLKVGGEAVVVVGDSMIQGVFIRNSEIIVKSAERAGFNLVDHRTRLLPSSSRYMPPPSEVTGSMSKRMRSEVVLQFSRSTNP